MATQTAMEAQDKLADPEALPGYLPWERDLEMISKYLDRKEELQGSYVDYMKANPELRAILGDFVQALLIQKPDDVYEFARAHFAPYLSNAPATSALPSHSVKSTDQ